MTHYSYSECDADLLLHLGLGQVLWRLLCTPETGLDRALVRVDRAGADQDRLPGDDSSAKEKSDRHMLWRLGRVWKADPPYPPNSNVLTISRTSTNSVFPSCFSL